MQASYQPAKLRKSRACRVSLVRGGFRGLDLPQVRGQGLAVGNSKTRVVFENLIGPLLPKTEFLSNTNGCRMIGVTTPICLITLLLARFNQMRTRYGSITPPAICISCDCAYLSPCFP
jgi:hypothetical protein